MTPEHRRQIAVGGIAGLASALLLSATFVVRTALDSSRSHDKTPLSLDICRDELQDTEALSLELKQKHEEERAELQDRLFKMADQLAHADDRAMDAAKELNCGKELLFEQWRADSCEKRLKGRIMQCPCVESKDENDPDDHGAAEGF